MKWQLILAKCYHEGVFAQVPIQETELSCIVLTLSKQKQECHAFETIQACGTSCEVHA
jgi:hypothetical protein